MSSNTNTSSNILTTTTTTIPVVKDDKLVWQDFCGRCMRILKDENKECKISGTFGVKLGAYLKKERKETYPLFTDEEIKERIPRWVHDNQVVLPVKVVKPRKGKAVEEKNTVVSVSSSASVISVASSKKEKIKTEPKPQDKRVEDIQNILTAVRALKNISPSLALETAITSLQAFIDAH